MQPKQYLFAVELGINGGNPVKSGMPVEFLGGTLQYQGANGRWKYDNTPIIGDEITRIRYNGGGVLYQIFGLYGITDGNDIVTCAGSAGRSLLVNESRVRPSKPLSSAHVLLVPDGRLYIKEHLLAGGTSNKGALKKIKQHIPGEFKRLLEDLARA